MLKQLLFIFIDNARKYSDDVIELLATMNEQLHIQIRNGASGYPSKIYHISLTAFTALIKIATEKQVASALDYPLHRN